MPPPEFSSRMVVNMVVIACDAVDTPMIQPVYGAASQLEPKPM